jgi:hypothetical protein
MPRPRKSKPPQDDSPPPAVLTPESERETITAWFRQRLEQSEREHNERIELLRTVGEHPAPVFATQARMFGMLGLPRDLAARMLQLSPHLFEVHYEEDYRLGTADVIASVAANAIRIGTSTTDPAAAKTAMDILARRGGVEWKPPAQQVKMEDDREKKPNVIDTSGWPIEKRQALEAMLREEMNGPVSAGVTGNGVAGMLTQDEEESGMAE